MRRSGPKVSKNKKIEAPPASRTSTHSKGVSKMSELYHTSGENASGNCEEKPGYYAIIPADVRYNEQLPPNAKLLYGEITALTTQQGLLSLIHI